MRETLHDILQTIFHRHRAAYDPSPLTSSNIQCYPCFGNFLSGILLTPSLRIFKIEISAKRIRKKLQKLYWIVVPILTFEQPVMHTEIDSQRRVTKHWNKQDPSYHALENEF